MGWEEHGWDEPSANIHQQWDKKQREERRSEERVCWE